MGQRIFRHQLTDSICKEYLSSSKNKKQKELDNCSISSRKKSSLMMPISKLSDKSINSVDKKDSNSSLFNVTNDYAIEYNLDDPLNIIKKFQNIDIRSGLINHLIPKNKRINVLTINLITKLTESECFTNLNLGALFGIYFNKEVCKIEINIISNENNNKENKLINMIDNRVIMEKMVEFMVFKTKVTVVINNKFIYRILPGFNNHSIILSYKNKQISFDSNNDFRIEEHNFVEKMLKDFIHHNFSEIDSDFESLQKMKLSINQQIEKNIDNIILPTIVFEVDKENLKILKYNEQAFVGYFKYLASKFKFVSLKLKFTNDEEKLTITDDKLNEIMNFINKFVESVENQIKEFKYIVLCIDISNFYYKNIIDTSSSALIEEIDDFYIGNTKREAYYPFKYLVNKRSTMININFQKLICRRKLENLTLAFIINQNEKDHKLESNDVNLVSKLNALDNTEKKINEYVYSYYNRKLKNSIDSRLQIMYKVKALKKIKKTKFLMKKIFEFEFGKDFPRKFIVSNILDYSIKLVQNERITN